MANDFGIDSLKKYTAILIAAVYLFASMPLFQAHDHEHVHVDHSEDTHLHDACHNFIYHGIPHSSEDKHSHFSNQDHDCLSCQFFSSTQFTFSDLTEDLSFIEKDHQHNSHFDSHPYLAESFQIRLRGPPTFV